MSETPEPMKPGTEPTAEQPSVELRPLGSRSGMPPAVPPADARPGEPESGPIGSGRGRHVAADPGDAPPPAAPPLAAPLPAAPDPAPTPAVRPEVEVEIVDAEIVDELPRPARPEDMQTDEWETVPTPPPAPPFPAAASAPGPYPHSPMGQPPRPRGPQGMPPGPPAPRPQVGPPPGQRPGLPARTAQPGAPAAPGVMVADTWETSPLPPVDDEYEGRRRRGVRRASRPGRAGWLVVLGVVLSLSAAVAVPFIITAPSSDDDTTTAPTRGHPGTSMPAGTGGLGPSGLPINIAPSETPSVGPSAGLSPSGGGSSTPSGASTSDGTTAAPTNPAPAQPPGAPGNLRASNFAATSVSLSWAASSGTVSQYLIERCQGMTCNNFAQIGTATGASFGVTGLAANNVYRFRVRASNSAGHSPYSGIVAALATLTLEAEAGSRSGCAQVNTFNGASGGRIVDRIGDEDYWSNCSRDGVVTFSNVSLPAGTFVVTIYHVFAQSSGDSSRSARLLLDPTAGNNIDFTHTYSRTTTVQGWTTPGFSINSTATFTISFAKPSGSGQRRAPALDRIVIQQTN